MSNLESKKIDKIYFRKVTKDLIEVQDLIKKHTEIKKSLAKTKRKLKSTITKYSFLDIITKINSKDMFLETAVKQLFNNIGLDTKHLINQKPKREDLQIWFDDCVILVECKGVKASNPRYDEVGAVKKYVDYRKKFENWNLPVHGLLVINHDNERNVEMRTKKPLDKLKTDYILAQDFGVITTYELVKGFIFNVV